MYSELKITDFLSKREKLLVFGNIFNESIEIQDYLSSGLLVLCLR